MNPGEQAYVSVASLSGVRLSCTLIILLCSRSVSRMWLRYLALAYIRTWLEVVSASVVVEYLRL